MRQSPWFTPDTGALAGRARPLSRRGLMRAVGAVTAAGVLLGGRSLPPRAARVWAGGLGEPSPIPGGVRNSRHYPPGPGLLVSTIDDFDGLVGGAYVVGTGTGFQDGVATPLTFSVDNRFMMGAHVASDGQTYEGVFAEF